MNYPLAFCVTGFPNGNTTHFKNTLCACNRVTSRFELGFGQFDSPRDLLDDSHQARFCRDRLAEWGIDETGIGEISLADNHLDMYQKLVGWSSESDIDAALGSSMPIVDKCPAYMMNLPSVMRKLSDTKFFVVLKNPTYVIYSWMYRARVNHEQSINEKLVDEYCTNYILYAAGLHKALNDSALNPYIYTVWLENLVASPRTTIKDCYYWLGETLHPDELNFMTRMYRMYTDRDRIYESITRMPADFVGLVAEKLAGNEILNDLCLKI